MSPRACTREVLGALAVARLDSVSPRVHARGKLYRLTKFGQAQHALSVRIVPDARAAHDALYLTADRPHHQPTAWDVCAPHT